MFLRNPLKFNFSENKKKMEKERAEKQNLQLELFDSVNLKNKLNNFFMNGAFPKKDIKFLFSGNNLKERNSHLEFKDCVYTKEEIDIHSEIQLENLKKANFESTIKNLDNWDSEHLIENKSKLINNFKLLIESKFSNFRERWTSNYKKSDLHNQKIDLNSSVSSTNKNLKSSPNHKSNSKLIDVIKNIGAKNNKRGNIDSSYNSDHDNEKHNNDMNPNENKLPDFLEDEERDQMCILLHNIHIFRKKFDFNIFIKKYENKKSVLETNNNTNMENFEISKPYTAKGNLGFLQRFNKSENTFQNFTRSFSSHKNINNMTNINSVLINHNNIKFSINNINTNLPNINKNDGYKNCSASINFDKNNHNFDCTKETDPKLFKKFEIKLKIHNSIETPIINTDKDINDSPNCEKKKILSTNIITNENYQNSKIIKPIMIDLKEKNIKNQENSLKIDNPLNYENSASDRNNNLLIIDNLENNFSKQDTFNNTNKNFYKEKFKIPLDLNVDNTFENKALARKDNYINKEYLKSICEFKKDLQVSGNVIFLNNGSVLNSKMSEDEKNGNFQSTNNNAFSILNYNTNNTIRLGTSKDRKKSDLFLKEFDKIENNWNSNRNNLSTTKNSKNAYNGSFLLNTNQNINSNNYDIYNLTENQKNIFETINKSNQINTHNQNNLKITATNNNDISEISNNENENFGNKNNLGYKNSNQIKCKDGNIKFNLYLIDKYTQLKDKKGFEDLDSVDYYKKIIKEKDEKESFLRKE